MIIGFIGPETVSYFNGTVYQSYYEHTITPGYYCSMDIEWFVSKKIER